VSVLYFSKNYEGVDPPDKRSGLYRWTDGPPLRLEKWNGQEWIDWPDLMRASGIGGDNEYIQITEEEADRLR
jgi:hypothetical protein